MRITTNLFAAVGAVLTMASCGQNRPASVPQVEILTNDSIAYCESVLADGDRLLVCNFGTDELNPLNTEGKGYVLEWKDGIFRTLIPADGNLSGPKGTLIKDSHLFIADVGKMVVYNLDTLSQAPQVVPFPEGELFVNDMALAGDTLYVTVTNTGNIYFLDVSAPSKLDPQALTLYTNVPGANGIVLRDDVMYVASYPPDGVTTGGNDKDVADNADGNSGKDNGKTRKKSDKNMDNYRKIVIADDSEVEQRYKSDYRGRVQDRNVTIKLEPMYALTYYEKLSDVKRTVHYHKYIDELNHSKLFPKPLRITNMESPLTEEQVRFHFALIDAHTSDIVADEKNAGKRFMRGLDFYLVQDFASSIDDFTQSILLDDAFFPAYFMRALVRYKQLEYKKAEAGMNEGAVSGAQEVKKAEVTAMDYDIVKNDLDHVIQLAPDFVYGYYNRGNVLSLLKDYRAALADYDKAIGLNPDFAEAYFNRGLTHIFLGNNRQGISDLSKAGELGIVSAYNIIKRFTNTQQ